MAPPNFMVVGERESVKIKVIVEPAGEGIITAHPVSTPVSKPTP